MAKEVDEQTTNESSHGRTQWHHTFGRQQHWGVGKRFQAARSNNSHRNKVQYKFWRSIWGPCDGDTSQQAVPQTLRASTKCAHCSAGEGLTLQYREMRGRILHCHLQQTGSELLRRQNHKKSLFQMTPFLKGGGARRPGCGVYPSWSIQQTSTLTHSSWITQQSSKTSTARTKCRQLRQPESVSKVYWDRLQQYLAQRSTSTTCMNCPASNRQ